MKNMKLADAIEQTGKVYADMLKTVADELRNCWVVNQLDSAKYLTDNEFEQMQGLIRKVELLKEAKNEPIHDNSDRKI